jgi:peptide/nickel transport system permease protein
MRPDGRFDRDLLAGRPAGARATTRRLGTQPAFGGGVLRGGSGSAGQRDPRVRVDYVIKRVALLLITIWVAATVNFILPRLTGGNAVRATLVAQAAQGGYAQTNIEAMVREFDIKFGLDKPLWQQYLTYLWDTARLDFNFSMANYPRRVNDMMAEALPWTIGLLAMSTLVAFTIGTLLGAVLAWPGAPRWIVTALLPPFLTLAAIPYYLLGLLLVWLLAFQLKLFPLFGGFTPGVVPASTLDFWWDVAYHSFLPALSIVLASMGFWALGMRAMMITVQGEDFVQYAEAKGLRGGTVFFRYAARNALLPQATALGLTLGHIMSGALLVELVFNYPGIGSLLYRAIRFYDHFTVQGIVFGVILTITLATFVLDLIYPRLDPRIRYQRA